MQKAIKTAHTQKKQAQDNNQDYESLIGKCLVNLNTNENNLYDNAVIYIIKANAQKVEGIIINKLLFNSAVIECQSKEHANSKKNQEIEKIYEDLYQGGPQNTSHGCVLFPKDDYLEGDPYAEIQGDIAISTSFGVLQEIIDGTGPHKKIIAMGHCEWQRGELEWEIFNNKWLIVPSNSKLLFETDRKKRWEEAKKISGIDLKGYLPQIGLA